MLIGYRLLDSNDNEVSSWGGVWGQTPSIPNPLFLPNGGVIHAPSVNEEYEGYTLIEWHADEPPATISPWKVSAKQFRLALLKLELLDDVEALVAQMERADQLTWEYATEFSKNEDFVTKITDGLLMRAPQIEQLFIEASKL